MNLFTFSLRREILDIKDHRDPKFRELVKKYLEFIDTPLDAKWIYEMAANHYTTHDLRNLALQKCFELAQKKLFVNNEVDYNFLFWLCSEIPGRAEKQWLADACLLVATDINQINDYLFIFASKDLYWQRFIALTENAEQARYARKFCSPHLQLFARLKEVIVWFKMGQFLPCHIS